MDAVPTPLQIYVCNSHTEGGGGRFRVGAEFCGPGKIDSGADVVYVNNTSCLPGMDSLDGGVFKGRLLGEGNSSLLR